MVHRQQTVDSLKKFNARRKLKVCSLSVIAATFQRPPGVPPGRPSHTWLRAAENDLFPIRPEPDFQIDSDFTNLMCKTLRRYE